jgi:DNA-directed RNA polymerase subunit RPC12/RpoP
MVTVRKFPTKLAVRCPRCQHQGVVAVFLDKPPKLRCAKCGSRDPIIVQRDRTRTWARQRRGSGATRD